MAKLLSSIISSHESEQITCSNIAWQLAQFFKAVLLAKMIIIRTFAGIFTFSIPHTSEWHWHATLHNSFIGKPCIICVRPRPQYRLYISHFMNKNTTQRPVPCVFQQHAGSILRSSSFLFSWLRLMLNTKMWFKQHLPPTFSEDSRLCKGPRFGM